MKQRRAVVMLALVAAAVAAVSQAQAGGAQPRYSKMAPLAQYLMADRNAEIALARSAAPKSISDHAEVMVLGRNGFEVAVPGTNHFVCLVERSWDAAIGDPVFWNPNIRGPDCFNEAAAKSYLPVVSMRTRLALAGKSQAQIGEAMRAAFAANKMPDIEPGAMSYMLSKDGYLNDKARNWHPHLMFFMPLAVAKTWGANLEGSPVFSSDDVVDRLTIFMVPVARWSDGTPATNTGTEVIK